MRIQIAGRNWTTLPPLAGPTNLDWEILRRDGISLLAYFHETKQLFYLQINLYERRTELMKYFQHLCPRTMMHQLTFSGNTYRCVLFLVIFFPTIFNDRNDSDNYEPTKRKQFICMYAINYKTFIKHYRKYMLISGTYQQFPIIKQTKHDVF